MDTLHSRLAPITRSDGSVDLISLGEIEQAHLHGEQLTEQQQAVYDAVLEDPNLGGRCLMAARRAYIEACRRAVCESGGVIISVQTRHQKGRTIRERRIERFPAPRGRHPNDSTGTRGRARTGSRARGAGRPKAQPTRSSSGDSGSEDGEPEPPPAGRLCECGCGRGVEHRAAQALYLNDQHAAADRQRRKRERDLLNGVPGLPVPCRCKPKRSSLEPGICWQCGHARGQLTADWVNDPGPHSQQLVIRDLTRRKWKTGDGKRHKVKHRTVEPRREVAT